MIPLRDHNPSGRFPFVTYALLAVNVAVFVYMYFMLGEAGFEAFINRYALVPAEIAQGRELHTLLTSMFLHGGIGHLAGNMLFLHIFGDNTEDRYGHLKFLGFYLLSGIAGSLLQFVTGPGSEIPNLGASGAIAGVMGAYLTLFPRERIDVLWGLYGSSTVPASFMLGYWILYQFLLGAGSLGSTGGGVAYFAHIGGFVFGWLVTRVFFARPMSSVRQV